MPLFTICNISLRCPQNVSVTFRLKIPHSSFLISFSKCLFWMEAETCCFCACLFKCKWAAAPRPLFQNRTMQLVTYSLYFRYSAKNICLVLIIMSIALKPIVLNHISLNFWYRVFWVHTSEARTQKAAITRHVSTKLSSLSCLIALKL